MASGRRDIDAESADRILTLMLGATLEPWDTPAAPPRTCDLGGTLIGSARHARASLVRGRRATRRTPRCPQALRDRCRSSHSRRQGPACVHRSQVGCRQPHPLHACRPRRDDRGAPDNARDDRSRPRRARLPCPRRRSASLHELAAADLAARVHHGRRREAHQGRGDKEGALRRRRLPRPAGARTRMVSSSPEAISRPHRRAWDTQIRASHSRSMRKQQVPRTRTLRRLSEPIFRPLRGMLAGSRALQPERGAGATALTCAFGSGPPSTLLQPRNPPEVPDHGSRSRTSRTANPSHAGPKAAPHQVDRVRSRRARRRTRERALARGARLSVLDRSPNGRQSPQATRHRHPRPKAH
jgi:hypothetical protein